MEVIGFAAVARALNDHDVPYLLVGGLAVVAHGHGRMTHDVDLVIDLEPGAIARAFAALASLGYAPRVPVTADAFADPALRRRWIDEKNMTVLNFYSDRYRTTPVDVFVDVPFDFQATHDRSLAAVVDGVAFRYVDLRTLIAMKEAAGRPVDLDDVRHLRMLADHA